MVEMEVAGVAELETHAAHALAHALALALLLVLLVQQIPQEYMWSDHLVSEPVDLAVLT